MGYFAGFVLSITFYLLLSPFSPQRPSQDQLWPSQAPLKPLDPSEDRGERKTIFYWLETETETEEEFRDVRTYPNMVDYTPSFLVGQKALKRSKLLKDRQTARHSGL